MLLYLINCKQIAEAEDAIMNWVGEIQRTDSKLQSESATRPIRSSTKPVRSVNGSQSAVPINPLIPGKTSKAVASSADEKKEKPKTSRLSGYDFRAWEKFDVDSALERMDQDEASGKDVATSDSSTTSPSEAEISLKRQLLHAQEMNRLLEKMQTGNMSDMEMKIVAGITFPIPISDLIFLLLF